MQADHAADVVFLQETIGRIRRGKLSIHIENASLGLIQFDMRNWQLATMYVAQQDLTFSQRLVGA